MYIEKENGKLRPFFELAHFALWGNYFSFGYPTSDYCEIDRYAQGRLIQHLQRRSQRPYQSPQGGNWLTDLAWLGLHPLEELMHA